MPSSQFLPPDFLITASDELEGENKASYLATAPGSHLITELLKIHCSLSPAQARSSKLKNKETPPLLGQLFDHTH